MTATPAGPALVTWTPALQLWQGDCLTVLRSLPDGSVHAVVTDPPYALAALPVRQVATALTAWLGGDREHVPDGRGFMGRDWDAFVPPPAVWDECLRVLKPGGYLLCFAGSRTVDLMGISIRLAGFQLRDSIEWLYGSGFPKSRSLYNDIDRTLGNHRPRIELIGGLGSGMGDGRYVGDQKHSSTAPLAGTRSDSNPITEAAKQWDGWGTALKPGHEPIIVAQKPVIGTIAANVLAHGAGGLNIDACRVGTDGGARRGPDDVGIRGPANAVLGVGLDLGNAAPKVPGLGRWPTNVVLSHLPECNGECIDGCAIAELDQQSGICRSSGTKNKGSRSIGDKVGGASIPIDGLTSAEYDDSGGASRFYPGFRCQAKAPKSERPVVDGKAHPTVKPLALMRWLVKLVTPTGGTVLDCYAGSGTTGQAAALEGVEAILIERDPQSIAFIQQRMRL